MQGMRGAFILLTVSGGFLSLVLFFHSDKTKEKTSFPIPTVMQYKEITRDQKPPSCTIDRRLSLMKDRCTKLGLTQSVEDFHTTVLIHKLKMGSYIVQELHKIIYCPNHKVASSTTTQLLIDTAGGDPGNFVPYSSVDVKPYMRSTGLTYIGDYNRRDMFSRLDNYYSFAIVRHPFDRLLSAYNEKFANTIGNFAKQPRLRRLIKKRFTGDLKTDENGNFRITFEQFLELLAKQSYAFVNLHWATYMSVCNPCLVKFKHIMRLETMEIDMPPLLNQLADVSGSRPNVTIKNSQRGCRDKLQQVTNVFRNISRYIVTDLLDVYKMDFLVYGYTWDWDNGAGCATMLDDNQCC